MELLSIMIKERDLEWPKLEAKCAEDLTCSGARDSSKFRQDLGDFLSDELTKRSEIFINYSNESNLNPDSFEEFFKNQENELLCRLTGRFGGSIYGNERRVLTLEKYNTILSKHSQQKPMQPIGFNFSNE